MQDSIKILGLGAIAVVVLISSGASLTGAAEEPTVDYDLSYDFGSDYSSQCRFEGSIRPGTADRIVVETYRSEVIETETSLDISISPGTEISIYSVEFEDTGRSEMIVDGIVNSDCEVVEV